MLRLPHIFSLWASSHLPFQSPKHTHKHRQAWKMVVPSPAARVGFTQIDCPSFKQWPFVCRLQAFYLHLLFWFEQSRLK